MDSPPCGREVGKAHFGFEFQVATVDGEAEVHVVRIHGVDADVVLRVGDAVGAIHHCADIGCAVAIVRDVCGHFSAVHCSEPCCPVGLAAACGAGCIAVAPTEVVGAEHCILGGGGVVVEHNDKVVPVIGARAVVDEVDNLGLLRCHLDILGVNAPPCRSVVFGAQDGRARNHQRLGECRELFDHAERLGGDERLFGIFALERLVVYDHQSLLAHLFHVGDGLELQVGGGDVLGHFLLKGHHARHVSHGLAEFGANQHLGGHARQFDAQRLLVFLRGAAADGLDGGADEVDVRPFGHEERADVGVSGVGIEVGQSRSLRIGLGHSAIGDGDAEPARSAVDGEGDRAAELGDAFVGISRKLEVTCHKAAVDVVAPFGVAARLIVVADCAIFCVAVAATFHVVGYYQGKVLVGVRCFRIDVERELRCPDGIFGDHIVFRERCPPAGRVVGVAHGVDIFQEAFYFGRACLLVCSCRRDAVSHPVGLADVV